MNLLTRMVVRFVFLIAGIKASGQSHNFPASKLTPAEDSLVNIYYTHQLKNPAIFSGRIFYGYSPSIEGHAFYHLDDWLMGTVLYDGLWHRDVELMYDLASDKLVVKHSIGYPVILFNNRVSKFTIAGREFDRLDDSRDGIIMKGFYERLTGGKATLYARRIKMVEEKIEGMVVEKKFIQVNHFFIKKDGVYHPVHKQHDLMRVLSDKYQELSRFKNQQNLKFKENPESFIVLLTKHYNQF